MANGDTFSLLKFFQRYTYESIELGGPNSKLIPLYESWYPSEVSSVFGFACGPTVVIDPQYVANEVGDFVLPPITCIGRFYTSGKIVAHEKEFDEIIAVWFESKSGFYMSPENALKLFQQTWRVISVPVSLANPEDW
jgi:hypothetical protein